MLHLSKARAIEGDAREGFAMQGDMKVKIAGTLNELLKRKDLDKITVKELVETCQISRQTFYYHFQDIMEVVEWCQNQMLKRSLEKSLQAPTFWDAIKGMFSESFQHRELVLRLMASQRREEMEVLFFKAVRTYLEELMRDKKSSVVCCQQDIATALTFCSWGLVGAMLTSLRQRDADRDKLAEQMCRLLTGEISFRFAD